LRTQPAEIIELVVRRLSVGLQRQAPPSKAPRLRWLSGLSRTTTLALALRVAFRTAHRSKRPVMRRSTSIDGQVASGALVLRGQGQAGLVLHPHQQRAHEALDAWMRRASGGAVLVIPTGGGKTATATTWLVRWLADDPARKVLWLAHQRELVDQAARSFADVAKSMPKDFSCRMRVIHGGGSTSSTLADPDLRIALGTMQSLRPDRSPNKRRALERFCAGPIVVVVDEAHRAVAPTYADLLDAVQAQPSVRVLGLTATPVPGGTGGRRRFRDRFPITLVNVPPTELIASGTLARPVFHRIDTHVSISMTASDVRQALRADLPPDVLRRLAQPGRNQLLVEMWEARAKTWGKTLVFATSTAHADALADAFIARSIPARSIHSKSDEVLSSALDWFRARVGPAVLISVGMLTEGVNLPEAETAFLARPTTSAVLLRQMVGRVLRGPSNGGTSEAHLVTLHDDWVGFSGVLDPIDLTDLAGSPVLAGGVGPGAKVTIVDSAGEPVPPGVLARAAQLFADHAARASQGAQLATAHLVGYYELADIRVPVFRHQQEGFKEFIRAVLSRASLQGRPGRSFFRDDPLPHPSDRGLGDLVREMRSTDEAPIFRACDLHVTPDRTARRILDAGRLSQPERDRLARDDWEAGGSIGGRTIEHWLEAVDARVRAISRRSSPAPLTIAEPEDVASPVQARYVVRDLAPLFAQAVEKGRRLLDAPDVAARLSRLPDAKWSQRPLATMHGYYTFDQRGGPVIVINRSLSVASKHVPDELLSYLLWHELLHHVLPGHGHDAEFRDLEGRWPRALDLDRDLDTLHERIPASPCRGAG